MTITGLAQVTAEWIGRKAFPFLRMHANGVISPRVKVPLAFLQLASRSPGTVHAPQSDDTFSRVITKYHSIRAKYDCLM